MSFCLLWLTQSLRWCNGWNKHLRTWKVTSCITVRDECLATSLQHIAGALETAGKKELAKQKHTAMLHDIFLSGGSISMQHPDDVMYLSTSFWNLPSLHISSGGTQMITSPASFITEVMEIIFRKLNCQWCH